MSLQTRLSTLITAIGADIKALQSATSWGAWTGLTFGPNWGDYGAGEQVGQYRKSSDGKTVQLRGMVKVSATMTLGGTNFLIGTLPVGARPPGGSHRVLRAHTAAGQDTVLLLSIGSDGSLRLWVECTGRALTYASGTYLSLDGQEFSTEA